MRYFLGLELAVSSGDYRFDTTACVLGVAAGGKGRGPVVI